ncbi:MAG: hypothetical protein VKK62_02285 [Synechococcaceae cyanobacterium]|nr:hypothetical protein [Synechococcaceae cyanobacterium]
MDLKGADPLQSAAPPAPAAPLTLAQLEAEAVRRGLLLRLRVGRPLGLAWTLRVGVARRRPLTAEAPAALELLADLKGWALPSETGLRLDTLRVVGSGQGRPQPGVAALATAAGFAWALEATPCRVARILAIHDEARQHRRLVRYFRRLGFTPLRELGAGPGDLAARLVWGGAGLLMQVECLEGLRCCCRQLQGSSSSAAG